MIRCSWVTAGLGITPRYTPWNQRFCQQFMWAFLDVWAIHKWISSPKTYLRFTNYDDLPSEVSDMRSHLTIFDSILTPSCAQRGSPWDFRGTFAKRTGPLLGRNLDASIIMYGFLEFFFNREGKQFGIFFQIIVQSIHPFQSWMQKSANTAWLDPGPFKKPIGLQTQDSCKCGPAQFENIRKGGHWLLVVLVNTFLLLNHQKQTWGLKFDTLGGSRSLGAYQWDWDCFFSGVSQSDFCCWSKVLAIPNGFTITVQGVLPSVIFGGAAAELGMGNLHRNGCFQTDSGTSSNLFYLYSLFKHVQTKKWASFCEMDESMIKVWLGPSHVIVSIIFWTSPA